jgi:hypothetical protein
LAISHDFCYDFTDLKLLFRRKYLIINGKRNWMQEPPDTIPTAQSGWQEPALPIVESGSTPSQSRGVSDEKLRKSHKHRGKPSSAPERDRKDKIVAQDDE